MALYLIVPTYKRNDRLRALLRALAQQTLWPAAIVIVDNATSSECRRTTTTSTDLPIVYIPAGSNLGPAGGTSLGFAAALALARDQDWLMRCDDDSTLRVPDQLSAIVQAADERRSHDPTTAAVGTHGAVWDPRSAHLRKLPSRGHPYPQRVDYLATNHFPVFLAGAARSVGLFRHDLFFGHDEVEYGLRLRQAGYSIYRVRNPQPSGGSAQPKGIQSTRAGARRSQTTQVGWRHYYSVRNRVILAREYGGSAAPALATVQPLLAALAQLPWSPRASLRRLRLSVKALVHAHQGRMGRTVEPGTVAGALDRRGESP